MALTSFFGGAFFAGEFFFSEGAAVAGPTPAGRAKRRAQRRWVLDVDGKDFIFSSLEALLDFLATREPALETQAVRAAERDAQRILRLGPAAARARKPKIKLDSPHGEVHDAIVELASRIEKSYMSALSAALARDADEIEDILTIAGILDD